MLKEQKLFKRCWSWFCQLARPLYKSTTPSHLVSLLSIFINRVHEMDTLLTFLSVYSREQSRSVSTAIQW